MCLQPAESPRREEVTTELMYMAGEALGAPAVSLALMTNSPLWEGFFLPPALILV